MDSGAVLPVTVMAALAATLIAGASLPTLSSMTVCVRSAALGRWHGFSVAAGIACGDMLFILLAIYGLALLADLAGQYFFWIRLAGALYLLWLASRLLRARGETALPAQRIGDSAMAGFFSGLTITLVDQKAMLFYLGFLPGLIDVVRITPYQTVLILLVSLPAVAAPKMVYALIADRLVRAGTQTPGRLRFICRSAGVLLMLIAVLILATTDEVRSLLQADPVHWSLL